jgi:hypothetical protein
VGSKKKNRFLTIQSFTIEGTKFHFISGPKEEIRNKKIVGRINITGGGGSYDSSREEKRVYLVLVSEGSSVYPYSVWEKMKERLAEQTGIAEQRIEIEPEESMEEDKSGA